MFHSSVCYKLREIKLYVFVKTKVCNITAQNAHSLGTRNGYEDLQTKDSSMFNLTLCVLWLLTNPFNHLSNRCNNYYRI